MASDVSAVAGYAARVTSLERQVESLTAENKRLFAENIRLTAKLRTVTAATAATTSTGGSTPVTNQSPPRRQSFPMTNSPAITGRSLLIDSDHHASIPHDKESPSAPSMKKTCSIAGCTNAILTRNLCIVHSLTHRSAVEAQKPPPTTVESPRLPSPLAALTTDVMDFDAAMSRDQYYHMLLKSFPSATASRFATQFDALRRCQSILEAAHFFNSNLLSGPTLLSSMLERIATLMHCERAALFMLDRQSRALAVAAEWRYDEDSGAAHVVTTPITLTADKGVLGYSSRSGRAMNVKDPLVEPLFYPDVDAYSGLPTRSFLCVPIHGNTPAGSVSSAAATISSSGSTVMACIQVVNKRVSITGDEHFSETDTALLTSLAMLAGQSMANAAAYEEAVKRRKQQERLLTMIQHMNADTGIDKLLFNVVDAASHLISLSRVSLYVLDDSTRMMVCKVSNDKGTVGTRVPISPPEGLIGHCVSSGAVINIGGEATVANGPQKLAADIASGSTGGMRRGSDATFSLLSQLLPHRRNHSVAFTGDSRTGLRAFPPGSSLSSASPITPTRSASVMAIPIRGPKGNVTAVIEAINNHGRTFVAEDEAVMKSLGRAAGIIMEKAHLYDQLMYTQRKTQALLKVQRASTEDHDVETIIDEILQVAYDVLQAERMAMFFVDSIRQEMFCVVSADVEGFSLPLSKGISGAVAMSGKGLNIPDVYSDPRFDPSFDRVTGNVTRSILCLPIKDATGKTIAVLQAVNKVLGRTMATHAAERPQRDPRGWIGRSQPLVPLSPHGGMAPPSLIHAPSLFRSTDPNISNMDDDGITSMDSRLDSPAEVFIQTETFERSARGAPHAHPNDRDEQSYVVGAFTDQDEELMGAFCIEVGDTLQRHYTSLLLERSDLRSDVRVDSLLVDYGRSTNGDASGSKRRGGGAGGNGAHSSGLRQLINAEIGRTLSSHPAAAAGEDPYAGLARLEFNCWEHSEEDLLSFAHSMMQDMGVIAAYDIPLDTLKAFFIAVRLHYRKVPYHCFYHGFSVMQFAYVVLKQTHLTQLMDKLDVLGLLIACLCHDVDHPGNTNAFEVNVSSRLALRYNDQSVLENHHASMAFDLLSKFNIFVNVPAKEYPGLRKRMIKGILATDMVGHFDHMKSMDTYLAQAKAYTLSRKPKMPPPIVATSDEPLTLLVSPQPTPAAGTGLPVLVTPVAPAPRTPPFPRALEGKYGGSASSSAAVLPSLSSSMGEAKTERKPSVAAAQSTSPPPSAPAAAIPNAPQTPKRDPTTPATSTNAATPASSSASIDGGEEVGPLLFDFEKAPAEVDRVRQFLFDLVLHSGDLQSVAVPVRVSTIWGERISKEFGLQAEAEKQAGIPVTEHMRNLDTLPTIGSAQRSFIDFIALPLYSKFTQFFPQLKQMLTYVQENRSFYERMANDKLTSDDMDMLHGRGHLTPSLFDGKSNPSPSSSSSPTTMPGHTSIDVDHMNKKRKQPPAATTETTATTASASSNHHHDTNTNSSNHDEQAKKAKPSN